MQILVGAVAHPAAQIERAYRGVGRMCPALAEDIVAAAEHLQVSPYDLANLIHAESEFDPHRLGPGGRPVGLIQFTPDAAEDLGTSTRALLRMSAIEQMRYVQRYLEKYAPFSGKQALFMAVFRPASRHWHADQPFPPAVVRANPGIRTPRDYVSWVERRARLTSQGALKP